MQEYCDVYKWTILKRTSPEVKCLHPTSSRREMCTLSVSNVIYHKFSHGAAFYTPNWKNVNVMLEFLVSFQDIVGLGFPCQAKAIVVILKNQLLSKPFTEKTSKKAEVPLALRYKKDPSK